MNNATFDGCGFVFLAAVFGIVALMAVIAWLVLEQIR